MPLLALRVELARPAAEALSEALLEVGAQSVDIEGDDGPSAALTALFASEMDPVRALREALQKCAVAAMPDCTVRPVADEDWVTRSQAQFAPVQVGRLWIGASWHEAPAAAVALRIDPGRAFGTGSHVTTRLVLAFLDRNILGAETVLDYGCGSGILAIAAAKLGAGRVDAVDVDSTALEVTRENARANAVQVRACLPQALPPGRYDVLVANILAQPLIELAPALGARAAPRAAIALAGLLASQVDDVLRAYTANFDMAIEAEEAGWVLLSGVRA
jgi:ribosomal protein L11 methyltransferase